MAFDRLHGEVQPGGDFLVAVSAGDELEDFALAGGEVVEVGVGVGSFAGAEGVEHEAGEAGREDGVAFGHAEDGVGEVVCRDRLGHISAGACADDGDDVFGCVGDRECEELHAGALGADVRR